MSLKQKTEVVSRSHPGQARSRKRKEDKRREKRDRIAKSAEASGVSQIEFCKRQAEEANKFRIRAMGMPFQSSVRNTF